MILRWQFPFFFKEKRASLGNPNDDLWKAIFGETETAGVTVNQETAMTLASVYSAINVLCNSLNIPINVYHRKGKDRNVVTPRNRYEYRIYDILHNKPNEIMTPTQWIQMMETSRNLYGNGFSMIFRDTVGTPIYLKWLHPRQVVVRCDWNEIFYDIQNDMGGYIYEGIPARDMIHVKTASTDGVLGRSVIDLARESMGFGISTQKSGNKFHENGMKASGVLMTPGHLDKKAKDNLQTSFDAQYAGTKNTGKTILLEEGAKYQQLTINPQDAQFLESREFSVTEVARWFNIPEHMLNNNARSTFNNIEHQSLQFITHNVRPRARLYEQEFNWKLLNNHPDYFTEFNMNALLRADVEARSNFYIKMVQNKLMTPNEIRHLENLNGYDGGDEFISALNLATDKQREELNDEGTQSM